MTSVLLFFECIILSLSVSLKEIKLIAIVIRIFVFSDFFSIFISFRCGLFLLEYSLMDKGVFLSP